MSEPMLYIYLILLSQSCLSVQSIHTLPISSFTCLKMAAPQEALTLTLAGFMSGRWQLRNPLPGIRN